MHHFGVITIPENNYSSTKPTVYTLKPLNRKKKRLTSTEKKEKS